MRTVMVRYKVKPDRAVENAELVRAVYDELQRAKPSGLRYATFQLDDGVSFVHIAVETEPEGSPLPQLEAFKEFQKDIRERCEEPPILSELRTIGAFRLFDDESEPARTT
ncbi:MAG: hypothetical protein JWN81_2276 [Solirubrobacterales bacterium]|jgi:hypothetical protein|nr:hypothetical protein [Solirubrobacterales bacterium]